MNTKPLPGHKVGATLRKGEYRIDRTRDGNMTYRNVSGHPNDMDDKGTSWIENDMLCNKWQIHEYGIKHCMTVFRNPEGTPEMKDEYLKINDFGIIPFSPVD